MKFAETFFEGLHICTTCAGAFRAKPGSPTGRNHRLQLQYVTGSVGGQVLNFEIQNSSNADLGLNFFSFFIYI